MEGWAASSAGATESREPGAVRGAQRRAEGACQRRDRGALMYLGIDLGTSSVKTVLFDREQQLIAQASAPLTVSRPRPGWSEQSPEAWWDAVETTVDAIARDHDLAGLRGIGL